MFRTSLYWSESALQFCAFHESVHAFNNDSCFLYAIYLQELTEFPIMAIRAEKEIKRYIPPRTGTLTLVVVDGFTLKV